MPAIKKVENRTHVEILNDFHIMVHNNLIFVMFVYSLLISQTGHDFLCAVSSSGTMLSAALMAVLTFVREPVSFIVSPCV